MTPTIDKGDYLAQETATNYQDADPRLLRLLGFLPHGAYG